MKTRKLPRAPRQPKQPRQDAGMLAGWGNVATGLGMFGVDKRGGATFSLRSIDQASAETLWRGDDVCARMVEAEPDAMLREGFEIVIQGDKDTVEAVDNHVRRLDAVEKFRVALEYARAYGGAGVFLGVNGGRDDISTPLDLARVQSLDYLTVFSPRELLPMRWFSNQTQARYGEISNYWMLPVDMPPPSDASKMSALAGTPTVDESRIIRFEGNRTSRHQLLFNVNRGWGDSIFVRAQQVISDFQSAFAGVGILLQDFATPVLKLKGLAKILAMQPSGASGEQTIAMRARAVELCRSIARTLVLDAEETYERQTVNVSGLGDLLEKMMLRLAQVAEMPVSLLMGQAPAGLNATGAADVRWYYDKIAARQIRHVRPGLERVLRVLFAARTGPTAGKEPENWDLNFRPLWQPTAKEIGETRYLTAQSDQIYITNHVATPQEIAKSRFGGDAYSPETHIDVDLRDEMLDDEALQASELGVTEDPEGGGLAKKADVPLGASGAGDIAQPPIDGGPGGKASQPSGADPVPQIVDPPAK